MSNLQPAQPQRNPQPLLGLQFKQMSWSPAELEQQRRWRRQMFSHRSGRRRKTVTDDDLDDLRGLIDLGFAFESNAVELDPKLADTLPALELFCAYNKRYEASFSSSESCSSTVSDSDNVSWPVVASGEDPEMVKKRLKQWAKVVACSILQRSTPKMRGRNSRTIPSI